MTEQNISLFSLRMWQYKIFVLNFLQFFYLGLDDWVSSIRIDWFGRNFRVKLSVQVFILILILDNKFLFRFCNFSSQNVRDFFLDYFARLGLPVSKFIRKQIPSLIVESIVVVEVVLFFGVILKTWKFGGSFGLVENAVWGELLWPGVFRDLFFTGSVIKWLVDWVDARNDLVGFIEWVSQIMVLFGSGYFFGIWIGALLGEINSELILDEVSNQNAVAILQYWVEYGLGWHCMHCDYRRKAKSIFLFINKCELLYLYNLSEYQS